MAYHNSLVSDSVVHRTTRYSVKVLQAHLFLFWCTPARLSIEKLGVRKRPVQSFKCDDDFAISLPLMRGKYEYEFVIDGE